MLTDGITDSREERIVSPTESDPGRLTIQQSFPNPRTETNPYIVMLKKSIEDQPDLRLRTFSWRNALLGRYDVFHVHWPEILVGGQSPLKAFVRRRLTRLLLAKLRATRTPIVRTMHNLSLPTGLSRGQVTLLRRFDRQTTLRIHLNTSTERTLPEAYETILHGHYRDWFAQYPKSNAIEGRLGYFGLVRRYKGLEGLLEAFSQTRSDLTLRIAGRPSSDALIEGLGNLAGDDPRIQLTFKFLTEQELVDIATESELIVLPYLEMHNSGGVLAALSLDRPVLVPANQVNERLSQEVGEGWIFQYSGTLTPEILEATISKLRAAARAATPNLTQRSWDDAGSQHGAAYRQAIRIARSHDRLYSR